MRIGYARVSTTRRSQDGTVQADLRGACQRQEFGADGAGQLPQGIAGRGRAGRVALGSTGSQLARLGADRGRVGTSQSWIGIDHGEDGDDFIHRQARLPRFRCARRVRAERNP